MKTQNILTLCCAALLTLPTLTACMNPSGVKVSQSDRPDFLKDSKRWGRVVIDTLSNLTDVQVIEHKDANADIYYVQSDEVHVVIEANENVRKDHNVFVKDSTLILQPSKSEQPTSSMRPSIVVRVYSPALSRISLDGTGDMKAKNSVSLPAGLKIESTGIGDVEFCNLTCQGVLNVETTGTGDVEMNTVKASSARLITLGTGDIDIDDLTCTGNVTAESTGTGDVSMQVTCQNLVATTTGIGDIELDVDCNQVEATATGSGDLELRGNTQRLIKEKSGLSNIRSKKLKVKSVEY